MKLYHYALFFVLICSGFFLSAYIVTVLKMQEESVRKTEYDCLVAAVNATAATVFQGDGGNVTETDLARAEDVFFQTLEVLWFGSADCSRLEELRKKIPCMVVFAKDGYYRYCFAKESGYGWSEKVSYEEGEIPEMFFEETEVLLAGYHDTEHAVNRNYRVEQAEEGVWERELSPMCVFVVYAPWHSGLSNTENVFLYAASRYQPVAYYVTEDNRCHLPFCEEYINGQVIACYATQKESAEDGAMPCEKCMR